MNYKKKLRQAGKVFLKSAIGVGRAVNRYGPGVSSYAQKTQSTIGNLVGPQQRGSFDRAIADLRSRDPVRRYYARRFLRTQGVL